MQSTGRQDVEGALAALVASLGAILQFLHWRFAMPSPAKKSPTTSTAAKGASKPAATMAETKSEAPTKPAADKPAAKPAAAKPLPSPAERMKMIAEAAYYLAQKRGFTGGNDVTDWVAAEKQVDALLTKRG
jgi:Protein of unknown function (DUF2934)